MREAEPIIAEIPANVIGVAAREASQAQKLMDAGMPYPLLLDPDNQVRQAIGSADRMSALRVLHPRGALAYLRSMGSRRFFHITASEATQRPGLVVLDAQLNPTWTHVGKSVGDYPALDVALTELRRAL